MKHIGHSFGFSIPVFPCSAWYDPPRLSRIRIDLENIERYRNLLFRWLSKYGRQTIAFCSKLFMAYLHFGIIIQSAYRTTLVRHGVAPPSSDARYSRLLPQPHYPAHKQIQFVVAWLPLPR